MKAMKYICLGRPEDKNTSKNVSKLMKNIKQQSVKLNKTQAGYI